MSLDENPQTKVRKRIRARLERERAEDKRAQEEADAWVEDTLDLAALLIFVGSIVGLITGALLISADPGEVAESSLFSGGSNLVVSGLVLSVDGAPVENATIQLETLEGVVLHVAKTTSDGRFRFTASSESDMRLTSEMAGEGRYELLISPSDSIERTITMPGAGKTVEEDDRHPTQLGTAIAVGSAIGILTILFSFFGFWAAWEARKGGRYRRVLGLSTLAMLSRGFIFIGPSLILLGMGLVLLSRRQFKDQWASGESGLG